MFEIAAPNFFIFPLQNNFRFSFFGMTETPKRKEKMVREKSQSVAVTLAG
jgi:hypothetical protein